MEIIYNKLYSKIIGNSNDKSKLKNDKKILEKSEILNNIEITETIDLSDSPKKVYENDNDEYSEEMPSSISSIDSIESIDSVESESSMYNKNVTKVRFKDEIKISEITENSQQTSILNSVTENYSDYSKKEFENNIVTSDSNDVVESSDEEIDEKLTIETAVEKKYLNSILLNKKKYYEEIKELNVQNYKVLELNVLKNMYSNVMTSLLNGEVLFKKDDNYNIVKLCSNKNCYGKCEKKTCNKSGLYYSLWNNIRGVKTIYNLLLKLIIIYPKFRNRCKCCEDNQIKIYLEKLENNFNKNMFNYDETNNLKLELKINYLINKLTSVIGIMACQCKFNNKYYEFYQDNYLNFRKMIQIYKRTLPYIIIMLKAYFSIKENHEELSLIKEERCMHEDIRYNNMTYCLKKKYVNFDKKKLVEIINNLELVNIWSLESFDISLLLYNEQSLETFRHVLYKYKKEINVIELFKKIYNKKNNILDLNYVVNKKNLINSILLTLKTNKNFELDKAKELVNVIINQFYYKNKKYKDVQMKLNEILLQYLIECYNFDNIKLGFEFFKNIKNLENKNSLAKITKKVDFNKYSIISSFPNLLNMNSSYFDLIKYIFNKFLESDTTYQNKISYLKIINKNKVNVIGYDFINKLIDIDEGEKIILELPRKNKNDNIDNYYLNMQDYNDLNYINGTIKKCIIKKRVNILDYLLNEINYKIENDVLNPYIIYFLNIDENRKENDYTELLKVIAKFKYNINNLIYETNSSKNNLNFLHLCIRKKLNSSAKILIQNDINTNIIYELKNLLFYSIDYKNHIVFGEILKVNSNLVNQSYNNIRLHTYLFLNRELDENLLMRFSLKLLENPNFKVNYFDKYNLHLGFQILESKLSKRNKVILFKIIVERIDPLVMKNNIPLIMNSVIIDEYEITYMLLNNLFTNKSVKKIQNSNQYLEYELVNEKISVNFVPLIFKYVKENSNQQKISLDELNLETDIYIENILVMTLQITICILLYKNANTKKSNNSKSNYKDNYDKIGNYIKMNKKIIRETIESDNNGYIELSLETDENQSSVNINKNIWKNPVVKTNKQDVKMNKENNTINKNLNIKFNFKSETIETEMENENDFSESSEIEESQICFDNYI